MRPHLVSSGGEPPPPALLRTVRDNLSSYGSRRPALFGLESTLWLLPLRVGLGVTLVYPTPWLQPHYRAFIATTSRSAPVPRGTLPLTVSPLAVLPLATSRATFARLTCGRRFRDDRFSCSLPAPATSSRHLYTGHRRGNTQTAPRLRTRTLARLCPGNTHRPRFRCHRSTSRCVSSGSRMFAFSSHT